MGRKFNYESIGSFGSENGAKTKKLWPKRCWLQCQATVTVSGSRVRVAKRQFPCGTIQAIEPGDSDSVTVARQGRQKHQHA